MEDEYYRPSQSSLFTFNTSDAFDYEVQRLTHPPITLYSLPLA